MKTFQTSTALLVFFLFHLTGWATTVIRMDLPALVQESDSVVQGQIERVDARWDDQTKLIFSYISVRVYEPFKGGPASTVLIRQIGGKVGPINLSVLGMPTFQIGEQVILFLKRNPELTYHVVGLSQGKYEIADGFAIANASGISLADRSTGEVAEGGPVGREPLETFKAKIRSLVK